MLIQDRIRTFEEANHTINKQCKVKKTRIQQREIFNIQNANALLNVKKVDIQLEKEIYINGYSRGGGCTTIRRCSNCSESGYNAYICKKDEEISNIYSFKWFQLIIGVVVD